MSGNLDDFQKVRKALTEAGINSDTDLNTDDTSGGKRKRIIKKPKPFGDETTDDEENVNKGPFVKHGGSRKVSKLDPTSGLTSVSKASLPVLDHAKQQAFLADKTSAPTVVDSGGCLETSSEESSSNGLPGRSGDSQDITATESFSIDHSSKRSGGSPNCGSIPTASPSSVRPEIPVTNWAAAVDTTPRNRPTSAETNKIALKDVSDQEFKRLVLTNLKAVRTQLSELKADVTKVLSKVFITKTTLEIPDEQDDTALLGLPVDEMEDLRAFDEKLKSKEYRAEVSLALGRMTGSTLGDLVRHVLRRIMNDPVAMKFSFMGGKGKERFDALRFKKVLYSVVRANPKFKDCTDQELQGIVAKWLANATTRFLNSAKKKSTPTGRRTGDDSSGDEDEPEKLCQAT